MLNRGAPDRYVSAQNKWHARSVGVQWRGQRINIHDTITPRLQVKDVAGVFFSCQAFAGSRDATEVSHGGGPTLIFMSAEAS